MDARKTKPQSWYLDVSMLRKYYTGGAGGGRVYHHTAPVNMTYALREALAIVLEEGLEVRIARHERMHRRLRAGLEAIGLGYIPKRCCIRSTAFTFLRAPTMTVRRRLLDEYGIEIGAGPGQWRAPGGSV
jgi:alanine-glyoxylate transaminase/serine-glyoxylate transaminase/serine-pyruvate transaminase